MSAQRYNFTLQFHRIGGLFAPEFCSFGRKFSDRLKFLEGRGKCITLKPQKSSIAF